MNTENNMNPMSLDDLFAASPAPVAPESTPLPEIAQTAPAETTVPEPTPSAEQQTTPFAAEQPAASQPDNIIDLFACETSGESHHKLPCIRLRFDSGRNHRCRHDL